MSSILGGRSGNRGRCAQPCRLPYDLLENGKTVKSGYVLSPKDMALVNDLGTLKRIGVTSLKIEGRLKERNMYPLLWACTESILTRAETCQKRYAGTA